jgi:hypothetical protein
MVMSISHFDTIRDASAVVSPTALRTRPLAVELRDGVGRVYTPIL